MLTFLPGPIVATLAIVLYLLNLLINPTLIILGTVIAAILPFQWVKKKFIVFSHEIVPGWWVSVNNFIIWLTTKTQWEIRGNGEIDTKGWYLLICNHQSWLDIIVLQTTFNKRAPMLKFFMKKELLWTLPIAGLACWAMGFPFMERYSKDYLKKHPEKAGRDIENTRRACEKFKQTPMTIVNFIEGTRFTKEKKQRQNSPYEFLLKPKAGGAAFTLEAMKEHLKTVINTTIIYPDPNTNFWRFMCGKVKKIIVCYEIIPVDKVPMGDYFNDQAYRVQFQRWLNYLWSEKDQLIKKILTEQNQ